MFSKLLPSIVATVFAIVASMSDVVQNFLSSYVQSHPAVGSAIVAVVWVVYHLLPSPMQGEVVSKDQPKV